MTIHLPEKIKSLAVRLARKKGENASEKDIQTVDKNLFSMNHGPVAQVWSEVLEMWNAFKSPETPNYIKIYIIGALIYLVSPLDIIPDLFTGAGLLDDVFVLSLGYKMLKKAAPQVKEFIKKEAQNISDIFVEDISVNHIKPAFCHFLFWQWMKLVVQVAVFIVDVLILKFSLFPSKYSMYVSSFLLFCVTLFFIVRAALSLPVLRRIVIEYYRAFKKTKGKIKNADDKSLLFKNIVAEMIIDYFRLEKEDFSESEDENKFQSSIKRAKKFFVRFSIRAVASRKMVDDLNKKELVKIIFETLKSQIISFLVCQVAYLVVFILFIRPSVLLPLTGMSFNHFIFYFFNVFKV